MSLPDALERAAGAFPADADAIRPANGDPMQLLSTLDEQAAGRVLAWVLAHESEDGAELALAWGEHASGLAPLQSVDESRLPKAARKALRRALHLLRSRGVEVGDAAPQAVVARLPDLGDKLEIAFVSAHDPRGSRILHLVESSPGGGARLFELMLDEVQGVLGFEVYSAGRSRVRRFLKGVLQQGDFPSVETPPAAARALIARIAVEQGEERPAPRSFSEWRARLTAGAEDGQTPGEQARAALGDELGPSLLERAVELVKAGVVGPWPPPGPGLERFADQLKQQAEGRIIVSGAQRREQLEALLAEAAGELYAGRFGEQTAMRFREASYVLWRSDRVEEARACLAAARATLETTPAENPVVRALLEIPLGSLLAELSEGEAGEEEPSLLVKP
jgi:hypothetical protein